VQAVELIPISGLLDDFAMREHTAMHADELYELISDCAVNGKPLILTSNRALHPHRRRPHRGRIQRHVEHLQPHHGLSGGPTIGIDRRGRGKGARSSRHPLACRVSNAGA
jgi:hypothetical protein